MDIHLNIRFKIDFSFYLFKTFIEILVIYICVFLSFLKVDVDHATSTISKIIFWS